MLSYDEDLRKGSLQAKTLQVRVASRPAGHRGSVGFFLKKRAQGIELKLYQRIMKYHIITINTI